MVAHLLQALDVLTELLLELVSNNLGVLAGLVVVLTVKKPLGHTEVEGVADEGDEALDLIRLELTSALVEADFCLLADQVGKAAADTLDGGKGVHHLDATIDVGVTVFINKSNNSQSQYIQKCIEHLSDNLRNLKSIQPTFIAKIPLKYLHCHCLLYRRPISEKNRSRLR